VIHLLLPYAVAAALVGIGTYGVLARRNAVLVLIGIELMLGGAGLLLVTAGSVGGDRWQAGNVLTLFIITIAAAEVVLALAVIVAVFRRRDNIDISDHECAAGQRARRGGIRGAAMTGPIAVAWALLVLVGGAPLILGAGLISRRLASGLAQLLALVAAGLGVVAVMGGARRLHPAGVAHHASRHPDLSAPLPRAAGDDVAGRDHRGDGAARGAGGAGLCRVVSR
jgi:NADH-quinone oxidoreductase subunit K